jgi:hypothetical protein
LPLESFIFLLVLTARLPPLLPEGGNRLLELFDYGNRMQALQLRHSALSQHSVADLFENVRNYLFFCGPPPDLSVSSLLIAPFCGHSNTVNNDTVCLLRLY